MTDTDSTAVTSDNDTPDIEPAMADAPVQPDAPDFADLGVRPETVEALAAVGITEEFAIPEHAVPIAIRGVDIIGQAPTGTGKTLGFGIPLLERVTAPADAAAEGSVPGAGAASAG